MREKTEHLQDLLEAGYRVEDIDSDQDHIDVTLTRGIRERLTIRLERVDAADLLGISA